MYHSGGNYYIFTTIMYVASGLHPLVYMSHVSSGVGLREDAVRSNRPYNVTR